MFPGVTDARGNLAAPLPLLILGTLRALGRSVTFDDLADYTGISEEVHRRFFHDFCHRWSVSKYPELVRMPETQAEFEDHAHEYKLAGLDGCFGSIDCVHIAWWRCSASLTNACTGKEGYTTCIDLSIVVHLLARSSCQLVTDFPH